MKNVSELTKNLQVGEPAKAERATGGNQQQSVSERTAELVNQIFIDLQGIFPAWKVAFPDQTALNNAKRAWTVAFYENGIRHTRQIKMGLKRARKSNKPHIPSVGEFIKWCQPTPEELNLPDAETAFKKISRYLHSDTREKLPDAVRASFNQIRHWDLTHMDERSLFPIFKKNYEHIIEKIVLGEPINHLLPKALPKPEEVTLTEEQKEKQRLSGLNTIQKLKADHFGRRECQV